MREREREESPEPSRDLTLRVNQEANQQFASKDAEIARLRTQLETAGGNPKHYADLTQKQDLETAQIKVAATGLRHVLNYAGAYVAISPSRQKSNFLSVVETALQHGFRATLRSSRS